MSWESSLARRLTRLLIEHRLERAGDGWTIANCPKCRKARPCSAESSIHHVWILRRHRATARTALCCDFCGTKSRLKYAPDDSPISITSSWTRDRPIQELYDLTAPDLSRDTRPESECALVDLLENVRRNRRRWKGTRHLGWHSLVGAISFGAIAAAVTHFTGIGKLWMLEDGSGSPLVFIVPIPFAIAGAILGSRDRSTELTRADLESRIKIYDLDVEQLRRLAIQRGHRYSSFVPVLDEMISG